MYSISYDLKKSGQDYSGLHEAIKNLGTTWARPCESYWLVRTSKNAEQVYDVLKAYIDQNDRLLVSRFDCTDKQGWLSKEIWNWINSECAYA